ncbi:hypothetical protein Salat_1549700 [Sesamum alatum]|uniref:Uncharacterized protein n=1 Tax=Sesamum alatum TaxID=300844 RepID=A0AAE1YCW0_9LAMI|nr:hypothetical protein Salat_1549700 [Sesamum alatum]
MAAAISDPLLPDAQNPAAVVKRRLMWSFRGDNFLSSLAKKTLKAGRKYEIADNPQPALACSPDNARHEVKVSIVQLHIVEKRCKSTERMKSAKRIFGSLKPPLVFTTTQVVVGERNEEE